VVDVGPALLFGAGFLVTHWLAITAVVSEYGTLPDNVLTRPYTVNNRVRGARWADTALAVVFGLIATLMSVLFLFAGGVLTLIGAAELVLAGWWLAYLLRANSR
jgi:hypothetical protein